jgi:2-(1,2-epoxy-1,2-dihydrophenyl)acetyl-CoA isomerase
MSDFDTVRYAVDQGVALITLNRPAVMNAFNHQMRVDLLAAVRRAVGDAEVRVVVLTGEGRGFSAGADLADGVPPLVQQQIDEEYKPVLMAISEAPKPFISAVNGAAAGIGSSFAMACDLTVMAENAYIYEAFIAIALVPDGGATWHLVRQLGRKRAFEVIIEGEKMSAARCLELGLANRVVPAERLLEETLAWARAIAKKAPLALRYSKEALNMAMQLDLADTISYEAKLQNITFISEDAREGVQAFFEKRPPVFRGR